MERIGEIVKIKAIAVTGIPSSGKSTACQIFKNLGAFVISSDEIVHELLSSDSTIIRQVVELLGKDIISNDSVDRVKIANLVFSDEDKLKALESILHPKVTEIIKTTYEKIKQSDQYKAYVVEFPLLFEIHFDNWFDKTIAITADYTECKHRFMNRGFSEEQFELRASRHFDQSKKAKLADITINNNQSIGHLKECLSAIL